MKAKETVIVKRPIENDHNGNRNSPPAKIRRIQPLKIGEVQSLHRSSKDNDKDTEEEEEEDNKNDTQNSSIALDTVESVSSLESQSQEVQQVTSQSTTADEASSQEKKPKNEMTTELEKFIKACRSAESNESMKKIIKSKLIKHYNLVSASFATSRGFRKLLTDTTNEILRDPKRVYSRITIIVEELKARKQTKEIPIIEITSSQSDKQPSQESSQEENGLHIATTGDKKKDDNLKRLNKALVVLKNKIEELEEAEVNLDDDDDSAYLMKVKYEKRAIEIYNKICELTGESTHAHRIVKKPIRFKDSNYKEFNKGLTKKINKENGFPSYYDVYRLLDFCNKTHNYQLVKYQVEDIARQAFTKVGELLKERRREDLYESACHWTRQSKDPAKEDSELKAKLDVNREVSRKKTEEILEYFTKKQYEENKGDQQPGTSKSFAIKDEIQEEEDDDCDNSATTPQDQELVSLIDVKAEQIEVPGNYDTTNDDSSSAAVINFPIS